MCGAECAWQTIEAGQAALWAAGEMHSIRADEPLVAIVVEVVRASGRLNQCAPKAAIGKPSGAARPCPRPVNRGDGCSVSVIENTRARPSRR